jgi:hypothetical protein
VSGVFGKPSFVNRVSIEEVGFPDFLN